MPLDRREALAVLRLPPSADAAAIKRAYRQLVRDHHPDLGGDPTSFQELQTAYEQLVDHRPSPRPEVRRGRPSRHHAEWSTDRDGQRPVTEVDEIDWDTPVDPSGGALDATTLAVRLAAAPPGAIIAPVVATSRSPGSRLNRVAASLSADLTASLTVTAERDDRGAPVVAATLVAGTRKARRALDEAPLDGGWVRTRGSATTTLRRAIAPDPDPRRTALRVVEPLDELLHRMAWPLASWVVTTTTQD